MRNGLVSISFNFLTLLIVVDDRFFPCRVDLLRCGFIVPIPEIGPGIGNQIKSHIPLFQFIQKAFSCFGVNANQSIRLFFLRRLRVLASVPSAGCGFSFLCMLLLFQSVPVNPVALSSIAMRLRGLQLTFPHGAPIAAVFADRQKRVCLRCSY